MEWTTHVNTLSVENPREDNERARADALWNLMPGDQVAMFAKAIYQGWENHVRRTEVKIEGLERGVRGEG